MIDFLRGTVTVKDWIFVAVVLVVTVLLSVVFYFLLLDPQQKTLAEKQAELAEKTGQLRTAQAQASPENIAKLTELAVFAEELDNLINERLPNEREFLRFFRKLEELSRRHNLTLKFTPGTRRRDAAKGLETWPYDVELTGQTHQILRFINDLEVDERYVRVDDLDIEYQEAGITQANFIVNTFRFIEGGPQPAPETQAS